jgi:NAD(P)-dependent dehydrogenase (short-subunit alcohol dehydrogenase family)
MHQPSFCGQVALVTGASRGLGLEIARHMAQAGAHLALLARDQQALEHAYAEIQAAGTDPAQQVRSYVVDLADNPQIDQIISRCVADFGHIDILINNAGIQGPIGPLDTVDWDAWQNVFQTNFFAAARLCQLLIPSMRSHGRGKIINISGGGATGPRPDFSAYASAKAALVRLSETLAQELNDSRIDVNCVAPGAMNTRMLAELLAAGPSGARREYARAQAQAQSGGTSPSKAAELVVFLASAASDGITGRLISALWDDWASLPDRREQLAKSDIYTLRRIVPEDRGEKW